MVESSRSRSKELLRWIAVLPGAFAAAFLVLFPVHWLVTLNRFDWTEHDEHGNAPLTLLGLIDTAVLEQLAAAFLTPFIVIVVAAQIAPRYRYQTAIALAILLGVVYGVSSTLVIRDIVDGKYNVLRWARLGLTIVLAVGGLSIGLLKARQLARRSE